MIAYDRLSQIIPPDQALANKALAVALAQISNIKNISMPGLASAFKNISTAKNLNQIESLQSPLPPNVQNYYANSFAVGTGPGNTVVITDLIGTAAGVGFTDQFANATEIIDSLTNDGTLTSLINIYGDMANSVNSVYGDAITGPVIIPSGPAAGTYFPVIDANSVIVQSAADTALTGIPFVSATGSGCIPAAQSAIGNVIAANAVATTNLNTAFNNMAGKIVSENNLLTLADINPVEVRAFSAQYSSAFLQSSINFASQVNVNGPAQYLEAVANVIDQGGQAYIAAMRQARNNVVLTTVGIVPNNTVDPIVTPGTEQANLLPSTYTTNQAANLIIQ
jgi:hypothetical protein